jgi:hypothetical protein
MPNWTCGWQRRGFMGFSQVMSTSAYTPPNKYNNSRRKKSALRPGFNSASLIISLFYKLNPCILSSVHISILLPLFRAFH